MSAAIETFFLQGSVSTLLSSHSSVVTNCRKVSVKFTVSCCSCSAATSPLNVVNVNVDKRPTDRTEVRLGLPSKGRMAADSLHLLKDCQLSVRQVNPRQYVAEIPQISNLEVWFQRPKDIVRKLVSGDLDLGIVGLDTVYEYGQGDEDLIIVHDALEYGECRLSLAIPKYGIFENVNSMKELAEMPQWTLERPLRVATGFTYMGIADATVDLVSSGTTLRKQSEGNRRWSHRAKTGCSCRWQKVPIEANSLFNLHPMVKLTSFGLLPFMGMKVGGSSIVFLSASHLLSWVLPVFI